MYSLHIKSRFFFFFFLSLYYYFFIYSSFIIYSAFSLSLNPATLFYTFVAFSPLYFGFIFSPTFKVLCPLKASWKKNLLRFSIWSSVMNSYSFGGLNSSFKSSSSQFRADLQQAFSASVILLSRFSSSIFIFLRIISILFSWAFNVLVSGLIISLHIMLEISQSSQSSSNLQVRGQTSISFSISKVRSPVFFLMNLQSAFCSGLDKMP